MNQKTGLKLEIHAGSHSLHKQSVQRLLLLGAAAWMLLVFVQQISLVMGDESSGSRVALPANASERIGSDLRYLSSDQMEGRGVESSGIDQAAEFIAHRWQDLGLRTDLFDGKPFQMVPIPGVLQVGSSETNKLVLHGPDGKQIKLDFKSQFNPFLFGRNGSFDAPLVFAGYGISADDSRIGLKYDDYASVDVQNKVVIVIRKEPQQSDPNSLFAGSKPSEYAKFSTKEANAVRHNAAALIFVNDSVTAKSDLIDGDIFPSVDNSGDLASANRIPTFFVRRDQIDNLMLSSLGRRLADFESEIDADLQPRSAELLNWRATGQADLRRTTLKSRNVVAVLPGEGALAKEFIVVGAHYDHVGMGGANSLAPGTFEVHNGADDNGSGTVALLEVSRLLSERLHGEHRTIIFIAFTGEERGLIGSEYYASHPRFSLDSTVAMINMDMVGRLKENTLTVYGTGTASEFNAMIDDLNSSFHFRIDKVPEGLGPSDHATFYKHGIPVFHLFTGLHNDYHRPSDDFDKINVTGMVRITDMVTQMVSRIATANERPHYQLIRGSIVPARQNPQRGRPGQLGIQMKRSDSLVLVEHVLPDSPAEKAGIIIGDRITKLGNSLVTRPEDLQNRLSATKPGDKVTLEVEQNNELRNIEVELGY